MIEAIALGVGYIVLFAIAGALVVLAFDIDNNDHMFVFTFLGFGIIVVKSEQFKAKANKWRQTSGRTVFINAPQWFNKYVWNIGGIKKPVDLSK